MSLELNFTSIILRKKLAATRAHGAQAQIKDFLKRIWRGCEIHVEVWGSPYSGWETFPLENPWLFAINCIGWFLAFHEILLIKYWGMWSNFDWKVLRLTERKVFTHEIASFFHFGMFSYFRYETSQTLTFLKSIHIKSYTFSYNRESQQESRTKAKS